MGGSSISKTSSSQTANAQISQQYSGTCNIKCDNSMKNVNVDIIGSIIGGDVEIKQACSVNGQCIFNTTQNATADIMFKAANSSSASNAGSWLSGLWNKDVSKSKSYQDINIDIQQAVSQTCNITSTNSMNNINIYAADSEIGGSLVIDQTNNAVGGCTLQTAMSAAAMATATADNCSQSGKKAKKACGGKGGAGIGTYVVYIVVALVIIGSITAAIKFIQSRKATTAPGSLINGVKTAGGLSSVIDAIKTTS